MDSSSSPKKNQPSQGQLVTALLNVHSQKIPPVPPPEVFHNEFSPKKVEPQKSQKGSCGIHRRLPVGATIFHQ